MGHLPLALFTAVNLRRAQDVAARLAVERRGGVLEPGGVGHVAGDAVGLDLEPIRGAVREARGERCEQLVQLLLAVRVAKGAEDADRLVARPDRPARTCVAVVDGELRLVEHGLDPRQEVVAVAHATYQTPTGRLLSSRQTTERQADAQLAPDGR